MFSFFLIVWETDFQEMIEVVKSPCNCHWFNFFYEVSGKKISKRRLNNKLCISVSQCLPGKKLPRKHSPASSVCLFISQRFLQEPLLLKYRLSSNPSIENTCLQTSLSVFPELVCLCLYTQNLIFHPITALNMPYIFLIPSEQCPWKLLLQLQLFLLLALRSSAGSVWFRMVLPRPEQWEWQVDWLMTPSRWNLPCSKGWKISVSNLLTLPFVPVLQPGCGSAPVPEHEKALLPKCPHWECFSIYMKCRIVEWYMMNDVWKM